jgi:hypothetical protein
MLKACRGIRQPSQGRSGFGQADETAGKFRDEGRYFSCVGGRCDTATVARGKKLDPACTCNGCPRVRADAVLVSIGWVPGFDANHALVERVCA